MKKCSICKVRPVDSPRGKYCAECRAALKQTRQGPKQVPGTSAVENPVETVEKGFAGCIGCEHWRDCGCGMSACHLTQDTGLVRAMSREECYGNQKSQGLIMGGTENG